MFLGVIFHDILMSRDDFFLIFLVFLLSFDVFGALGGSRGPNLE